MFFCNIPANSHPFQWPLSPPPIDMVVSQLESLLQKSDWFPENTPAGDMIHSDPFLSCSIWGFLCSGRWALKALWSAGKVEGLLYQTGRAQGIGAEMLSISGIPVAFLCVTVVWCTLGARCKGSFVCSGFPVKEEMLVFVWASLFIGPMLYLLASFFSCGNASKAFPIGAGFF